MNSARKSPFDRDFHQEYKQKRNLMLGIFLGFVILLMGYGYYRETYEKPEFMTQCQQGGNTFGECELIWVRKTTPND